MAKILITTNHPAPYINKECEILSTKHDVSLIYKDRKDKYKTWKGFVGREGKFYDELGFIGFLKEYKRNDVAILGGWLNFYCLFTILLSFLFKTKCCVFSDHPMPNVKKNVFFYFKKYILFHSLDFIFCATESTRQFYHINYDIPQNKLVFFPYSYDNNCSKENDEINKFRIRALNKTEGKINIFIANSFIQRKGYDVIVKAFKILHEEKKLSQFKIVIAGNGELFDNVKNEIDVLQEDISFTGWIENDEYRYYMNYCDIYIHASKFEPFGIPPLDALCRGKLLIASNGVESVSSLINNGIDGYIYESENAIELAAILGEIKKSDIYKIGLKGKENLIITYNDDVYFSGIELVSK